MQIVVADDDEMAVELLAHALQRLGHEVLSARNGREALHMLRDSGARMLISDWEMPHMTGLELCRSIRGGALPAYVYIIMLTGVSDPDAAVTALEAGADEFLSKPFRPVELGLRVRTGERVLSLETRDVTIFALAKLAESRDPETGAHLERVQNYSRILASDLAGGAFRKQINAEFVRLIHETSPLHDIGKIGIPDGVLLKRGKLMPEEFAIMKTHTTMGARTLEDALARFPGAGFLRMARDIALCHHEKFDGSGYPQGLAGQDIPLSGRIVAVADVYDALCSRRVYKDAINHAAALKMITEQAGKHFDPEVVDALVRDQRALLAIRKRFADDEAIAA